MGEGLKLEDIEMHITGKLKYKKIVGEGKISECSRKETRHYYKSNAFHDFVYYFFSLYGKSKLSLKIVYILSDLQIAHSGFANFSRIRNTVAYVIHL